VIATRERKAAAMLSIVKLACDKLKWRGARKCGVAIIAIDALASAEMKCEIWSNIGARKVAKSPLWGVSALPGSRE